MTDFQMVGGENFLDSGQLLKIMNGFYAMHKKIIPP